ncbi:MAG: nucleotidyltransferase domain-containing protein [Ignavibacteria bacterium]|jgi:predicted nucleotidyltransferase|nr:nucleotidyltransferase domain-containing protein [Ignavibacteria bacterium]
MLNINTIETIKQRLKEMKEIESIILFGSQARGTADNKSDIDLAVIVKAVTDRYEMSRNFRSKLSGMEYAFDIIVITKSEYDLDKHIPGTVSRSVEKEGKILYAS